MILGEKKNDTQLMALLPSMKKFMNEWQVVNINIAENSPLLQTEIIQRLLQHYHHYEGLIYPVSPSKIVMLARFGILHNYAVMKTEIEQKLPQHCCRILLRKLSAMAMKQVQIDISARDDSLINCQNMYTQRAMRRENVLLVADDERMARATMATLLGACGTVIDVENGTQVLSSYVRHNPDIVFLDIHMPGKSGLDLIQDIITVDPDAFIVVLSADSMKDNVLKALEDGAAGFLSKPPQPKKVQDYIGQCITVR